MVKMLKRWLVRIAQTDFSLSTVACEWHEMALRAQCKFILSAPLKDQMLDVLMARVEI